MVDNRPTYTEDVSEEVDIVRSRFCCGRALVTWRNNTSSTGRYQHVDRIFAMKLASQVRHDDSQHGHIWFFALR